MHHEMRMEYDRSVSGNGYAFPASEMGKIHAQECHFEKEFAYETFKIGKSEFHGFMLCPWFIYQKVNQSVGECDHGIAAHSRWNQHRVFDHVSGGGDRSRAPKTLWSLDGRRAGISGTLSWKGWKHGTFGSNWLFYARSCH